MAEVSSVSSQKTIEQIIKEQEKKSKSQRNTGELGKDDFLKLLITQVQHQDPMNPASDTDFIAQMAQFSSLEQMQNLNNSFSYSMGFGMMGKYISAEIKDEDTGEYSYVTGLVESVRMVSGKVVAVVDGKEVPIEKISQVSDSALGSANDNIVDYSGIIGLLGKAHVSNSDGKQGTVSGIIASVRKEKDGVYAYLDEVDLKPEDLDLGGYENLEQYVAEMTGNEVTVKFKDPDTGAEIRVKGELREVYVNENTGETRFVLDRVKTSVDSVYSTEKIDLFSTEQLLLGEILKALKGSSATDPNTTNPDGNGTDTTSPAETESGTESSGDTGTDTTGDETTQAGAGDEP